MKVSAFDTDFSRDIRTIIDGFGQWLTVNGQKAKATVNRKKLSEQHDDRVVTTTSTLQRGNLVAWKGSNWLVASDVSSDVCGVFKGIMRACNFMISVQVGSEEVITGYDHLGRPITQKIPIYVDAHCIIDNKTVSVDDAGAINIPVNEIMVMVQDNTDNKRIDLDHTFVCMDGTYKVTGIDLTQNGLIKLSAKKAG